MLPWEKKWRKQETKISLIHVDRIHQHANHIAVLQVTSADGKAMGNNPDRRKNSVSAAASTLRKYKQTHTSTATTHVVH